MKATIDKAGRVVIPALIRARIGLRPGTELEVSADGSSVVLVPIAPGPRILRVGKRLVARPALDASQRPRVDVAGLVEAERDRWPF